MIKVGRLPGRMYSVEYTEGITVGQAVANAKAQAEEAGRSLETVNCQVRVAGSEVSEGQVLTDNAVVTITQKIKGNSPVEVHVDDVEYLVENDITARALLQLVEKDPNKYNLIPEFGFYAGTPLASYKSIDDCNCFHFSTVEVENNEEEYDYCNCEECNCDCENEEQTSEEEHTCNCGRNVAVETIRPMRPSANTNFNYSNNGVEVYISVSNSNEDMNINKVLETSKVIYNYVKGVVDGL